MSKYVEKYLLTKYTKLDKKKLKDVLEIIEDFGSGQMFFELEGFITYYNEKYSAMDKTSNEKYSDMDKTLNQIKKILNKCKNEKDFIFYGEKKNASKIELIQREKNIYDEKVEIVKGTFKCNKCNQRDVSYVVKYVRSADEPPVILFTCLNNQCNNTWREG